MKFFARLKKEIWRAVKTLLILGIIITVVISAVSYGKRIKRPETVSMIIDSDSGNEIDDLYAITLALINPKIELIGLCSAQWHAHPNAGDSSVYVSQIINDSLLQLHQMSEIPHPRGGNEQTGYWGDTKIIPSPAATFIVNQARLVPYGEKINIVTLGSVTNLVSAIMIDSTIIPKIRWYGMGLKYDDKNRVWNKNEFNVRNDLDGMDYLLNSEDLESHIMTATTSQTYQFDQTETFDLLRNRGPQWDYLVNRWKEVAPQTKSWTMWDVALIQAIMNPDLVTEKEVWGPAENYKKRIFVYTYIDEKKMKREYFKLVRKRMGDIASDIE